MIFVTLGTQDKTFSRLLKSIEKSIKKGTITDKVIVQSGSTKFKSNLMEVYDFLDMEKFKKYLMDADFSWWSRYYT